MRCFCWFLTGSKFVSSCLMTSPGLSSDCDQHKLEFWVRLTKNCPKASFYFIYMTYFEDFAAEVGQTGSEMKAISWQDPNDDVITRDSWSGTEKSTSFSSILVPLTDASFQGDRSSPHPVEKAASLERKPSERERVTASPVQLFEGRTTKKEQNHYF